MPTPLTPPPPPDAAARAHLRRPWASTAHPASRLRGRPSRCRRRRPTRRTPPLLQRGQAVAAGLGGVAHDQILLVGPVDVRLSPTRLRVGLAHHRVRVARVVPGMRRGPVGLDLGGERGGHSLVVGHAGQVVGDGRQVTAHRRDRPRNLDLDARLGAERVVLDQRLRLGRHAALVGGARQGRGGGTRGARARLSGWAGGGSRSPDDGAVSRCRSRRSSGPGRRRHAARRRRGRRWPRRMRTPATAGGR